ncbi:hypothetical protein N7530_002484 [Penicillium desertorum]|uniref:Heme haloperoxidase family profile domain-containing protein n=1 Tax=Penicillium desertorum TaxID=1303715 RepID=A0A9W9X3V5_9EURO|nr:hypothetical protein N7530_002484 [Penicillium desertorum]
MKFYGVAITLTLSVATASSDAGWKHALQWKPGGESDYRGPCPMMNTLANHGFLPHDGRNITRANLVDALGQALNFNGSLASLMFDMGVVANPEPNSTVFTLDDLNRHNVLEHDASLSRSDAFFGNNHAFNETIFEETKAYWTGPILDPDMLANSKVARQINSKAHNPTYTFTAKTEQFSLGEVAAPVIAFGDIKTGTVNRSLVEYFFENERLPTDLGWKRPAKVTSLQDILSVTQMIEKASHLITPSEPSLGARRQGSQVNLHG